MGDYWAFMGDYWVSRTHYLGISYPARTYNIQSILFRDFQIFQ